jgi:hypothetical protein
MFSDLCLAALLLLLLGWNFQKLMKQVYIGSILLNPSMSKADRFRFYQQIDQITWQNLDCSCFCCTDNVPCECSCSCCHHHQKYREGTPFSSKRGSDDINPQFQSLLREIQDKIFLLESSPVSTEDRSGKDREDLSEDDMIFEPITDE